MASTHLHSVARLKAVVLFNKEPSCLKVPCLDFYELFKERHIIWHLLQRDWPRGPISIEGRRTISPPTGVVKMFFEKKNSRPSSVTDYRQSPRWLSTANEGRGFYGVYSKTSTDVLKNLRAMRRDAVLKTACRTGKDILCTPPVGSRPRGKFCGRRPSVAAKKVEKSTGIMRRYLIL